MHQINCKAIKNSSSESKSSISDTDLATLKYF